MGRKINRKFLDWKNSFLPLIFWLERFAGGGALLLCSFLRLPSLGGYPIIAQDGKTAKGAELSRTGDKKKEMENKGERGITLVLTCFYSFSSIVNCREADIIL